MLSISRSDHDVSYHVTFNANVIISWSCSFCADFHSKCHCSFTNLLERSWSLPLLLPIGSILSAKRRLHMGLPPMEMDVWWPWGVSCMIISMNKLNRMGESKHSWQIPIIVLKNSPSWLFKRTAPAKVIETKATTMLTSCCWSPDKQAIYRLLGVVRASQLLISWNLSCGWCQFVFWISVVD